MGYQMSDFHRMLLRKNGVFLLKNMKVDDVMIKCLIEHDDIMTDTEEEIIRNMPTNRERARELQHFITRRGPKAFSALIHALCVTKQDHVAKQLCEDEWSIAMFNQTRVKQARQCVSGGNRQSRVSDDINRSSNQHQPSASYDINDPNHTHQALPGNDVNDPHINYQFPPPYEDNNGLITSTLTSMQAIYEDPPPPYSEVIRTGWYLPHHMVFN